jgi:hypothetical protein
LLDSPSNFSIAPWFQGGSSGLNIISTTELAPDGTNTAYKFSYKSQYALTGQYITLIPGETYTVSVYAKSAVDMAIVFNDIPYTGAWTFTNYDLHFGVVEQGPSGTISTSITAENNGFYRCSATFIAPANKPNAQLNFFLGGYNGDDWTGSTMTLWGPKLEIGSVVTPYQNFGGVTLKGHTPPPTIVTDGLVLHYDFSDINCYSGGVTINDLSTANNEGSVVNDAGAISQGSDSTVSYFIWSTSAGDTYAGSSIQTASQNTYNDFTIVFQPDFTANGIIGLFAVETDKSVRFGANGIGGWGIANPGNNDDWSANTPTTYYINGQASNTPVAGWNIMGGARNNSWNMPNGLLIGTSDYTNRHFQGKIALVLMYNRALTEQEQLQNYNALKARFGL